MQTEITPELEHLLAQSRERWRRRLFTRELRFDGLFALTFVLGAIALAELAPGSGTQAGLLESAAFVVALAVVASLRFETGAGFYTVTQIVFVPMLLLAGPENVPLLVALAYALRESVSILRGRRTLDRMVMAIADGWYALGPAIVLVAFGAGSPDWSDWPVYVLALLAQFAVDGAAAMGRARLTLNVRPRHLVGEMVEVYKVDALLTPVGLLVAFAAVDDHLAALLVLPLAVLFRVFSREREARVEQQLELSRAYRGTALLLGDVIEDDDEYTGQHTRGVVLLAGMVADELGVGEDVKRDVEFGALLHDVGKIAIPKEIINKPGPLDAREWEIMKTHTIEGERLLQRVGGILARVGTVVRASHERWDGTGYPDGLAREEIPLAARIVSCCDAYNAMTTDRSYRRALPAHVALRELRANAGTQFDPKVVDAVVGLVQRWDPEMLPEPVLSQDVDEAIRALLAGPDGQ